MKQQFTGSPLSPRCHVCGSTTSETFIRQHRFAIVKCTDCGLRYLYPQPEEVELSRLYGREYFESADPALKGYSQYLADADHLRRTFRSRLRLLKNIPRGKLLDVGAAAGFFVEQAILGGWDAEGVEPSAFASSYARDTLKVKVHTGTLDSVPVGPGSYDLATMWEVIEHLPDPRAVLNMVRRLLKPRGYLALTTPDAGSLVARAAGRRWLGWRKIPEHLYYFDFKCLQELLADTGFQILDHRYVSITVSAEFALRRFCDAIGVRPLRLPRALGETSVSINPFYDLFVLSRALD